MGNTNLQQGAHVGVQRRLPELLRVHFAEPLVARQADALAAELEDCRHQADRTGDAVSLVLGPEFAVAGVSLFQLGGHLVEAARLAGADQRTVDDRSEEHTSELQSLIRISYAVF